MRASGARDMEPAAAVLLNRKYRDRLNKIHLLLTGEGAKNCRHFCAHSIPVDIVVEDNHHPKSMCSHSTSVDGELFTVVQFAQSTLSNDGL
jgi:hypothetical protein